MTSSAERREAQERAKIRKDAKKGLLIFGSAGAALLVILYALPQFIEPNMVHGEQVAYHHHVKLQVYQDGKNIDVPQYVGIQKDLWANHTLDSLGVGGFAPLHTHAWDGLIHIEPKNNVQFTLGDFLNIWGLDTSHKTLKLTNLQTGEVDNGRYAVYSYPLDDGEQLRLDITTATVEP